MNFITGNAVEIELQGEFSFSEHDSCASVAYLGVELVQGDSDEVKDLDEDVTDNNVRFAQMRLKCTEGKFRILPDNHQSYPLMVWCVHTERHRDRYLDRHR